MLLFGGRGHAKVIIDAVLSIDEDVELIFDTTLDLVSVNGFDVENEYDEELFSDAKMIIAIEDNLKRQKAAEKIKHQFGRLFHNSAVVSNYARIGEGTVILQQSVVTSGSIIGKHCIINTAASVEYDCTVGDYVHISPRVTICSDVKIGEGTHIGAGATVIPGVTIGKWCVVGAGAVITQNLPDYSLVVGVPGKVIRTIDKEEAE